MPTKPLHILAMKKLAEAAMMDELERVGMQRSGLFLMMHPSAIASEGRGVFEYAMHEQGSDVPTVKARASVDALSGDVRAEASQTGWLPWPVNKIDVG